MQGYPAILQHTSVHGITLREYIEYKNNFLSWKELAAFYYNFGLQTALFLALRITDLHYENVLISNNYPVFFDLECSFAPDITEVEYSLYLSGIVDSPLLTESFWPLL